MGIEQAWLLPAYGFVSFGIIALSGKRLPAKYISVTAVVLAFLSFWPILVDFVGQGVAPHVIKRVWFTVQGISIGSGMIVDSLTIVMMALVTFIAMLVQIYSLGYMRHEDHGHVADDPNINWYFAAHSLFTASMLTLVLADNLLLVYFAWELVGLCSYLLIGFWWQRQSAVNAAKKAFITTRVGDVGLLIGILVLCSHAGTFNIPEIIHQVEAGTLSQGVITFSAFAMLLGAMGKSAQFPLHVWLPDAMEGPTPVSALIHAATMVTAGVFLVGRMLPLYEASYSAQLTVAIVGMITALMGASLALVMTDLKRMLAYSTMSHLGFMMLTLGAGGLTAAIFHLLMHGISKAMLFLTAGSVMHSMHDETDMRKMGGLIKVMPITGAAFTIGALSLSGIVPFAGFWSKDEMLTAVKDGRTPIFLVLFLGAVILSSLYMARGVYLVFFGRLKRENEHVHESPPVMAYPLIVLAVLSVIAGLIAISVGGYGGFGTFLYQAGQEAHKFEFSWLWFAISTILAVGSFYVGITLYRSRQALVERLQGSRLHTLLMNRYYMDHLYQWIVDKVVLAAGALVALFDRRVVNDIGVNGWGYAVVDASKVLRRHVTGLFADYGFAMAAGVSLIVLFAWWRTVG